MALHLVASPPFLYRVGVQPDPLQWRRPDGPLTDSQAVSRQGGRWDAPHGDFGTLYLADSPVVAFAETIASFRPKSNLKDRIWAATNDEAPDMGDDPPWVGGSLPRAFFEPTDPATATLRALARCRIDPKHRLVDVSHPDTWHELTGALDAQVRPYNVHGFDRGAVMSQDRRITRLVAGYLHGNTEVEIVGIRYESRFVTGGWCVALWERASLLDADVEPITRMHPALQEAAALLHIEA